MLSVKHSYPCPVVKTMPSLSAVNEAFAGSVRGTTRSQHSAVQSPGGGEVCFPAGCLLSFVPWHHGGSGKENL